MVDTKLTTVKIIKNLYSKFKKISFDSNITLQKLVNRSVHKYINEEDFRNEINNYEQLQESGSAF
jgi:hypothetical protein